MRKPDYSIQDFLETKAAFAASFNHNGSLLLYLSNKGGTAQLYSHNRESGEVRQLTSFEDPISSYSASPKEDILVFSKAVGGNENMQLFVLDLETLTVTPLSLKQASRYNLGSFSRDGSLLSFSSNERNGTDFDVYIRNMDSGTITCVFEKGGWAGAAGFSPFGTYLAVRQDHSNVNRDLFLVELSSKNIHHLTPHEGDATYGSPRWTPDESKFYLRTDEGKEFIGVAEHILGSSGFTYRFTPSWDVEGLNIDRNGKYLILNTNEDGYSKISFYNPTTLAPLNITLPEGEIDSTHFSKDGQHLAYSKNDSRNTTNVFYTDLETNTHVQVTHSYQGVPAEVLVEPKLIRIPSFDGLLISGYLFKSSKEEEKRPLIFNIHGGPEGQFRPGPSMLTQYFVHHGYDVFAPNVRGSTGYGKTFVSLDNVEKRLDSVKDLVAFRDHLLKHENADEKKIILMGGSYGGFMVLAGLAFHPELWAGGVDIVGIVNFETFLENTAPYRRALREAEYGSLEKDRGLLKKISPINSIQNIQAPLFVIHGANDPRVPLLEAQQVRDRLRELGRSVELLVYDDEGHGLGKLKNRLDAYPKVAAFIEKIVGK